jgi:hypothetical protein
MNQFVNLIILVTRPEHDAGTRYLSCWMKEIISEANKKGIQVIDLHKEKASRKNFESRMDKLSPDLILLNGHGSAYEMTGHNNEVLICHEDNHFLLKKKITYAIACDCAKILGKGVADKETVFIGYKDKFVINLNRSFLSKPAEDKRAKRFLDPSNEVGMALLKGHTASEASSKSKEAFRKQIISLLSSTSSDPDITEDIKILFWNMTNQVCLGNGELKLC